MRTYLPQASNPDPLLSEVIAARHAVWVSCGIASSCRKAQLDPVRLMELAGDRPLSRLRLRCKKCGTLVKTIRHADVAAIAWPVKSREILVEEPWERLLEL